MASVYERTASDDQKVVRGRRAGRRRHAPAWSSRIDATGAEPPRAAGARADGRVPRPRRAEARKRAVAAEDLAARAAVVAAAEDLEAQLDQHRVGSGGLVGDPARLQLVRRRGSPPPMRPLPPQCGIRAARCPSRPRRAPPRAAPRVHRSSRRVVAAQRARLLARKPNPTPSFDAFAIRGAAAPAAAQQREAEAQRRRRAERVAGVARAVGARGRRATRPKRAAASRAGRSRQTTSRTTSTT